MKKLLWIPIMLLLLLGCSSDDQTQPAFRLKRIDITFQERYFIGGQQNVVEIPVDTPLLTVWIHAYNEIPICKQVMEIYNENNELYMRAEFPLDPCLSPLSNPETEAWTLGFEIHTLQGEFPKGKHTLYAWIESGTGQTSSYEAVDIYFGSLKQL